MNAYKRKDENSFIYKHMKEKHKESMHEADFNWKIIGQFRKPKSRQLSEAIHINRTPYNERLNHKNEFFKQRINKLGVIREDSEYVCNFCGGKFSQYSDLQNHKDRFHMRYSCENCEYLAFGRDDLQRHNCGNQNNQQIPTSMAN